MSKLSNTLKIAKRKIQEKSNSTSVKFIPTQKLIFTNSSPHLKNTTKIDLYIIETQNKKLLPSNLKNFFFVRSLPLIFLESLIP